ncbi:MAG: PAS domain S-box protein, partial [bacterium]|nr:PAS domain S-box protein [bacterium]
MIKQKEQNRTEVSLRAELDTLRKRVAQLEEKESLSESSSEALKKSEADWRSLAENSPDHIMIISLDYKIRFINYTVPDLKREEVIRRSVLNFLPADQHPAVIDCFEQVFKSGKPGQYESRYVTTDGKTQYFIARVAPVLDPDGKVREFINCSNNITAQKEMERKLRVSERKHRSLFE